MREIIETSAAPSPIGPYSQAVRGNGFIFVSGQIPVRPDTGTVAGNDIESQTRQVMMNLEAILKAAGVGLDKVVKTTVFLSILTIFPRSIGYMRNILERRSRPAPRLKWHICPRLCCWRSKR